MGGHTLLQGIFLTQGSKLPLLCHLHFFLGVSVVAQLVKNPPAMRETWVWSLCWAEPLEEGMATHSSILAWRIPGTEEPGGLQSMGPQRVGHDCMTKHSLLARTHCLPFGQEWPALYQRGETVDQHTVVSDPCSLRERIPSLKAGGAMQDWQKHSENRVPYRWRRKQNRLYLESRAPSWAGLWTLSYMLSIFGDDIPTGKPGARKEEPPRALHRLKEYPNYLCDQIESSIRLCLLVYDHRPIDNCPLLTT